MIPIPFHERERVLAPPTGKHDEIAGLRIVDATYYDGSPMMISCWQLSDEDLETIIKTRKIYHAVLGNTHSPTMLTAHKEDIGL